MKLTEEKLVELLKEMELGGYPPTMSYDIDLGQFERIIHACSTAVGRGKSKLSNFVNYTYHWTSKLSPNDQFRVLGRP